MVVDGTFCTIPIVEILRERSFCSRWNLIAVKLLMKDIKRLCNIGVLEWQPSSRWASPTFIIPKKDSTVHTISDFRELNKCIVRKPYPIPKISTILQELEGFIYATTLDLNIGYYTIRLDPTASEMCTIIFPWGKYSYKKLPMGFGGSVNIFQAQIMDLMASLEFVRAYMDLFVNHHERNTGRAPSENGDSASQIA